jgi:4-amino-4-deoxy-L-arabinose transferase-like glycosyltransferase
MLAFLQFDRQNYLPVLTIWFGAAACYLMAFDLTLPSRAGAQAWLKIHWKELFAIGLITVAAAVLRFYKLGDIPRVINGDEGWIGNIALTTVRLPYANPFSIWENIGGLYLQAINWMLLFFGTNPFSLRLLPAIAGTLAIPALYLLARQIAGRRIALIAAILLAFSHTHLNFSRTVGVGYIQDTWLVPLELFLVLSGLQKRSPLRMAAAGVLLGIHFSIYLTPQIFAGMLVVFFGLVLIFYRRQIAGAWHLIWPFTGGLVVMMLPEAVYAVTHTNEFFTRLNNDGVFQSGWLAQQMASTGQSAEQILGGRVLHAFLSLIYYPAISFYGSMIPVLSLFTATLFLIGLVIVLLRTRALPYLLLNGYFWAGILAIWLFAIPETADSYRIIMILPAALLMAAIGLDSILEALGVPSTQKRFAYAGITGFLLLNLLVFNSWTYFVDFAGKCRYGGDPQTRFASYLGKYMAVQPGMETVYLLSNDTYRYGTHASTDFLSGAKPVINVPEGVDTIPAVSGDVILANPDRTAELQTYAHDHPGGTLLPVYDCQNLILLSYQLP